MSSGAILVEASLMAANLHGADLRGTLLSGADLSGADLSVVRVDEKTVWPDDFPVAVKDPDLKTEAAREAVSERRLDEILLPGAAERIDLNGPC